MTTIKQTYEELKGTLEPLEARRILNHVLGLDEDVLITNPNHAVDAQSQARIKEMAKRCQAGEPLSKIIGLTEFWGLPFHVTKDTLDPRADTETLIEAVLDYCRQNDLTDKPIQILDLGTGTGCIPIALLSELPQATGVGVDISNAALAVAQKNAVLNELENRIQFIKSDWCAGINLAEYDIIVSNPPYIRDEVIPNLDENVKNHDPILALSGGKSGLDAYEKILFSIKNEKNMTARIFFEIGFDQQNDLVRLVDESNLSLCDSRTDLGGNPRVVEIIRGDK
ncbi:MAG: peptide chain release factor N(5)-glutamine methyltransferase [Pseudomonadota bacterium]